MRDSGAGEDSMESVFVIKNLNPAEDKSRKAGSASDLNARERCE